MNNAQDNGERQDKIFTARISRHLLYNSLNSAIVLCRRDPEKASELLNCLSHCLIYASEQKSDLVPLVKEIDFIKSYLYIQSVRFGQRLRVVYSIMETGGFLPPFSLQPIVDNVFKHVMLHTREVVTLVLEAHKTQDGVIVTVRDDRVGMDPDLLDNMWQYCRGGSLDNLNKNLIKNGLPGLSITSKKGKGTSVSIRTKN